MSKLANLAKGGLDLWSPVLQVIIVYSLILGPHTFSDFFCIMKVFEEIVSRNYCAVQLPSENMFGLKIWGV